MKLEIKDLNKVYPNGNHALKDLNLTMESGMFGLLGANGAGKSTLMKILVTLQEQSSGEVFIDGMPLSKNRGKVRSMLGYLPQDFRFFADLKVHEYLDYGARLSGLTNRKFRRSEVERLLEEVGLYEVRNRMANHLSGGMKRRLGIAQALIADPSIVIVDEPTTGLDPEERIRFRNILSNLATDKDVIIILSTHIVGDISSTCERMALLDHGSLVYNGSPEDIIKKAEGSVWQLQVTHDEFKVVQEKYPVISTIPTNLGWEVQVVSSKVEGYNSKPVAPNLEHAYVHFLESELKRKWHES